MHTVYPVHYPDRAQTAAVALSAETEAALRRHLENRQIEQGGILGMSDGVLSHYYHDARADCDRNLFRPSADLVGVIDRWQRAGICFVGLIHSHPADRPELSPSDIHYAHSFLRSNPRLPALLMGIMAGEQLLFYGFERECLSTAPPCRPAAR